MRGAGQGSLDGVAPREGAHVVEMQRRRLLTATVELVYERRTRGLTVATICDRARVSRRTFYELFDTREECLLATFKDGVAQATETVIQAASSEVRWRERVRMGLTGLLSFLDYEPGIGRLLIIDALAAGEETLDARQRVLTQMITIVDEGRSEAKASREPPPLTAEGIVGAVFAVIHARMIASLPVPFRVPPVTGSPHIAERGERPLGELAGALMAIIVGPYLGPVAAQKELDRPMPSQSAPPRLPADPFKDLPIRLTYRTARVLATIATDPGASNRQIGQRAGAPDQGQVSKLLGRLQRHGLIENHGNGHTTGEPNAWQLTPRGLAIHTALGSGSDGP